MTDERAGSATEGRLRARPGGAGGAPDDAAGGGQAARWAPGLHRLGLDGGRDGFVLVPASTAAAGPVPLVLALHGAGGTGRHMADLLAGISQRWGLAVLAPDSRGTTWDVLRGGYGPDVLFLDRALAAAFAGLPVDPARVAVAGFSDGASYALSLGIANGDLFGSVLAYSPGFAAPAVSVGTPRLFVSHGVGDGVLPIDRCSRRLVPRLRGAGHPVRYLEFAGGHTVPDDVLEESARWLLDGTP